MECSVADCSRTDINQVQGLCHAHDQRRRRGKPLDTPILNRMLVSWPDCHVEGCDRRSESKTGIRSTVCAIHAAHVRAGRTPTQGKRMGQLQKCTLPGCEEPFRSSRLCNKHDTRRRNYGIDTPRFIEVLTSPCGICGATENLHIDHDHACCPGAKSCGGCVRGALCGGCNLGLGAFRDNPTRLALAIQYLSENGID